MCRLVKVMERRRPSRVAPETPVEPAYFRLLRELDGTMDSLSSAGVHVKDPGKGLVDFPARRDGRAVWLCWKVGEPTVEFWHELDDGFAGRVRIDEDGPWEAAAAAAALETSG
jgi:hypothetical protein